MNVAASILGRVTAGLAALYGVGVVNSVQCGDELRVAVFSFSTCLWVAMSYWFFTEEQKDD
jgi:hypothetical protein